MPKRSLIRLPTDVKPDNVLLNCELFDDFRITLGKVVLADLDTACKFPEGYRIDRLFGNPMWRSPEGHLGKGICKSSGVFSFGLVVR